ncbi:MAG: hypothetical protein R2826_10430 [Thermoleophilia bacterium]
MTIFAPVRLVCEIIGRVRQLEILRAPWRYDTEVVEEALAEELKCSKLWCELAA